MSTSVCTGQNPFNFIRKHFLQICLRCFLCTQLLQFLIDQACVGDHDTLQILTTKSTYRSLSAQRLFRTHCVCVCVCICTAITVCSSVLWAVYCSVIKQWQQFRANHEEGAAGYSGTFTVFLVHQRSSMPRR